MGAALSIAVNVIFRKTLHHLCMGKLLKERTAAPRAINVYLVGNLKAYIAKGISGMLLSRYVNAAASYRGITYYSVPSVNQQTSHTG